MKHAHHLLSFSFFMDDMDEIFLRVVSEEEVQENNSSRHDLVTEWQCLTDKPHRRPWRRHL